MFQLVVVKRNDGCSVWILAAAALVVVGNEKQQSSIELASESISLTERDEANEITK